MGQDRFRRQAQELRTFANRMAPLAKVPDRATSADFQLAAELATKAADSLDELLKAQPPGCTCRRIENDNYSYLDCAESCIHHRQYHLLSEALKAEYTKMEKELKNAARLKFVAAALTGIAASLNTGNAPESWTDMTEPTANSIVARAIELADEVVRQITGAS